MKQVILISREGGETRACLLISGKLVNIDAEGPSGASLVGNIYKGRITDISDSLNAAFVDIGQGKEGFLSSHDLHPSMLENYSKRPVMSEMFRKGQEILVQVVRDAEGEKGVMLTTCVSLPGRYVVLIPAVERIGISRKLPEEERKRLRELIKDVNIPAGFGVIVRTAGENRKKAELVRDIDELVKLWKKIEKTYHATKAPSLVMQEQSLAVRFLREYLTSDVSEIVVDHDDVWREVARFLDLVMPKHRKLLCKYTDKLPLFTRYNVESQIENMFLREVRLPSGGKIVIDQTEALVAIDVNSGRHKERDVEETALKTNLEAADEIATQLMLRDLGGLIVIDFIDMCNQKNRTRVQQRLKQGLKRDKAKISIGRISQFGLLEMSRQRLRSGMLARATERCERCSGLGYHRTVPSSGLQILRKLREAAASGSPGLLRVTAPVAVANFMQNSLRDLIYKLEEEHGVKVVIEGEPGIWFERIEQEKLSARRAPAVSAVQAPLQDGVGPEDEWRLEGEERVDEPVAAEQSNGGPGPVIEKRRSRGSRRKAQAPAEGGEPPYTGRIPLAAPGTSTVKKVGLLSSRQNGPELRSDSSTSFGTRHEKLRKSQLGEEEDAEAGGRGRTGRLRRRGKPRGREGKASAEALANAPESRGTTPAFAGTKGGKEKQQEGIRGQYTGAGQERTGTALRRTGTDPETTTSGQGLRAERGYSQEQQLETAKPQKSSPRDSLPAPGRDTLIDVILKKLLGLNR